MPRKKTHILAIMAILLLLPGLAAWGGVSAAPPETKGAAEAPPAPDPEEILRQMTDYLKSLKQFSFRADITDDQVYTEGKKLQYSLDLEVSVRRPDKLRVNAQGDLENQEFFYDGKTLVLYHKKENLYALASMPPTIDEALTKAHLDFDLQVALTDLACNNAYELMTRNMRHKLYVGLHPVRGVPCHHLAFDQDNYQWQIWVEAGDKPLPRKMLINQKKLLGSPQWTAYLTDWNLAAELPDSLFTFVPPAGALQTKFLPPSKAAAPQTKAKGKKKG